MEPHIPWNHVYITEPHIPWIQINYGTTYTMELHVYYRTAHIPWNHVYYGTTYTMEPCILWNHIYHGTTCIPWNHVYYRTTYTMEPCKLRNHIILWNHHTRLDMNMWGCMYKHHILPSTASSRSSSPSDFSCCGPDRRELVTTLA